MRALLSSTASLAGCVAALGGCAAPGSGHLGFGQVAGLGAGTAAGAVLGEKIGGPAGALVGGAAGLAGTALVENALSPAPDTAGPEQARREERLKVMQRYWYEHTAGPGPGEAGASTRLPAGADVAPTLSYPAGYYAGVRFAPRAAATADLNEPPR